MDFLVQGWGIFQKGGLAMYLILCCSLIVVGIAVERFLYFRTAQAKTGRLATRLTDPVNSHDWPTAKSICVETGGIVAAVAVQGIVYLEHDTAAFGTVLEGEASLAVAKLSANLNHLETIVTVAPLLGLLGTVIGMINSFSVLNIKTGQPLAITGGVGEALVATASGLCVAIMAMAAYSYFNHRLDRFITELQEICVLLAAQWQQEEPYGHK